MMDARTLSITKVPISGWKVTGLPIPDPPLSSLHGDALLFWENSFKSPASVVWGPSELVLLERLAHLYSSFLSDANGVLSEMRQLEASLGLTIKARRDLKLQVVSDRDFIDDLRLQGAERSFAMIPLDVITGLSIDELAGDAPDNAAKRRAERFG